VETIQFRLGAVVAVVGECPNAIAELERLRDVDPRKRQGIERDIEALTAFVGSMESQLALTESFPLTISGEHQVRNAPIKVVRQITDDQLKNWRPRQPVIVVILETVPEHELATDIDAVVGQLPV
jgi:hypothetical protein